MYKKLYLNSQYDYNLTFGKNCDLLRIVWYFVCDAKTFIFCSRKYDIFLSRCSTLWIEGLSVSYLKLQFKNLANINTVQQLAISLRTAGNK